LESRIAEESVPVIIAVWTQAAAALSEPLGERSPRDAGFENREDDSMIDLYTWCTPNGFKVSIALEELELPYRVVPVDISAGAQFTPEFLAISPNNKIPAIVDREGPANEPYPIFESGAILLYLAEKTGRLIPQEIGGRFQAIQWLMFQMGGLGPMLGQAGHFKRYAPEKIPYAIERYTNEAGRLLGVLDRRLGEADYLAGEYSIADIACFPWVRTVALRGDGLEEFPNLSRWHQSIAGRPAVQRGLEVPDPSMAPSKLTDEAREILFGDTQYQRR
jgi:GST-like protein